MRMSMDVASAMPLMQCLTAFWSLGECANRTVRCSVVIDVLILSDGGICIRSLLGMSTRRAFWESGCHYARLRVIRIELEGLVTEKVNADIHYCRIVETSSVGHDFGKRSVNAKRGPVRSMRTHCLDDVGDGDDPCLKEYVIARKPLGIA